MSSGGRRGKPSVTAGPAVARGQVPGAAGAAADLTAIRHSDAVLGLLAQRQLSRSLIRRDPALAVLSVLAADVDGPAAVSGVARRAAARRLASWRARRLAVKQAERLAARQAERSAARRAERLAGRPGERVAGQRPQGVAARHAELAARAAATTQITARARLAAPPRCAGDGPARAPAARSYSVSVAAIAGSALAALVLAVVAAGSTGILAAALLTRLARLGAGPPGQARGGMSRGEPGPPDRTRLPPPGAGRRPGRAPAGARIGG